MYFFGTLLSKCRSCNYKSTFPQFTDDSVLILTTTICAQKRVQRLPNEKVHSRGLQGDSLLTLVDFLHSLMSFIQRSSVTWFRIWLNNLEAWLKERISGNESKEMWTATLRNPELGQYVEWVDLCYKLNSSSLCLAIAGFSTSCL